MDNSTLYFWFSFNPNGEKLSNIPIDHGEFYSRLTYVLLSSLSTPPGDQEIRERVEIELGFAVIQAWNQIVKQDLMSAQSELINKKVLDFPDIVKQQSHKINDDQLFCYPFQLDNTTKQVFITSILWLLSKPQFKHLQTHFLSETDRKVLKESGFYYHFENHFAKPILVSAYPACPNEESLRDLAVNLQKRHRFSSQLNHLLYRSLDRLAEIDRERHPTHPQIEFNVAADFFYQTSPSLTQSETTDHHQDAGHTSDDNIISVSTLQNTAPDWGKELVIIAKLLPVWLHQLSLKYGFAITTLDQIPDQELLDMKELKITGLWLVGVWCRSEASRRIKNALGNPNALASAYSIFDYEIDPSLGGKTALKILKDKANRLGIHLGADVIPNHTAIDSRWLQNNPDWFISSTLPPYPAYSYQGQSLSDKDDIVIKIEDHYYDHQDAAVVFQYLNRKNLNEPLYIYHGNDGTHVPWNDTAQLDYLNPAVRKNMIDTIIAVSKDFPLIRLDAAMTLTRMHYKRLWYPPPGEGGAIPSRSGQMSSNEEFDARYGPIEFWQEVLIALNKTNPNALLLAEAFWLMEPYFINNIGMHKVYHSAFMNLLRDYHGHRFNEYIQYLIRHHPLSTLNHFVNFLSTPDEAPAAVAFGKSDRFTAASVLLTTFPGTPLFSHNQWEGLEEQYGMEFAAPMNNIPRDNGFFNYYQSCMMPLLVHRSLFSQAEHFQLLSFQSNDTGKSQNVIAFTNQSENTSAYVIVNYQDSNLSGQLQPTSSTTANTSKIKYLGQSHNTHFIKSPFSDISLGPWGYCVFLVPHHY